MSPIEYEQASLEVRAVYDDIRKTRKTEFINNFWKALANNPAQLKRDMDSGQGRHGAGNAGSTD